MTSNIILFARRRQVDLLSRQRQAPAVIRKPSLALLVGGLLLATACATPIGVVRATPQEVHRSLTVNVLSAGEPSASTQQVLRRLGLADRFEEDPERTLSDLRGTGASLSRDRLGALAELCFLYAERTHKRDYYLTAAVYAYAFLLVSASDSASLLDPRLRLAADLYNLGMSLGLVSPDGGEVILGARTLPLAFGELALSEDTDHLLWGGYRMNRFIPVIEYEVRGLRNRYRQPGIGVPLAAEVIPVEGGAAAEIARRRIPPRMKVPVTAFVRLENAVDGIASGRVRGRIEIYPADEASTVDVDNRRLPLELEPTATLAYMLEGAPVWDTEIAGFLRAGRPLFGDGLVMFHPYRAGRVPVVLIHGTASSPARWAEMVNELQSDPVLKDRIQFWLFTYNTSNPILLSASELRGALRSILGDIDPEGRDPALRRMVLIGHSQGGLLARLMVTDSGPRFWDNVSTVPLSELTLAPATRALFERTMFFTPLPFVSRVIFIATPHRGSFRVSSFVLGLIHRVVTLPVTVVQTLAETARQNPDATSLRTLPTAVDNMRPGHPFLRALSSSPTAEGVTTHSIVAVRGEGPVLGQTDGVVAYDSAHLEGVASEKVVRSGHSTQGNTDTILEVRRILREMLDPR